MTTTATMTEEEYLEFVLTDPDEKWELHDGKLRCKPPMTWEHIRTAALIHSDLQQQLGRGRYIVISEAGRLRRDERHYYIPDVIVVPVARARAVPGAGAGGGVPGRAAVRGRSVVTLDRRLRCKS